MRILHFLHSHAGQGGELVAHVTTLATAQAKAGHEVGLICIDSGNRQLSTPLLEKADRSCTPGVIHLPVNTANIATKLASALQANIEAVQLAGKLRPQIVHGHGAQGGRLACQHHKNMKQLNADIWCVYSPHNTPQNRAFPDNWPLLFPEKQDWKYTNGIIFESEHCKQAYTHQNGAPSCPTRVIYEGLSEAAFAPRQIIDMASDFLFVGPFIDLCGAETLVQVLARLKKDYSTGALFVGSGPRENQLRAQVDRYGLSHNVFFNASLDPQTAFLKGGCLILPAKQNSIPMITLQAGAAGVPMILANTGSIQELVGDVNMPLVAPNDPEDLLKQMIDFLQHPQLFLERATALTKRISNQFTLTQMTTETELFYNHLISR